MSRTARAPAYVVVYALAALGVAHICGASELPAYRSERAVSRTIRIWGSPADGWLIEHLEAGFRKFQPHVTFAESLYGPESAFAGIYTGVADLAFMAREIRRPMESMAFEWVHQYKAFEVEIANAGLGSSDRPGVNLAIFVHKDNPLTRLTLAQVDAILGTERRRGAPSIRKWGDLAISDDWKDRPIHVYGPEVDSIAALYIRRAVLDDSRKWNPDYRELAGYSEVLASLARDPAGITYAPVSPGNENVKPVELGAGDTGPFYGLTPQTVAARTYPLTRVITLALDREPGKPLDPKVKEFLRYVLSREGQAVVASDEAYIPLSAESARRQVQRLD